MGQVVNLAAHPLQQHKCPHGRSTTSACASKHTLHCWGARPGGPERDVAEGAMGTCWTAAPEGSACDGCGCGCDGCGAETDAPTDVTRTCAGVGGPGNGKTPAARVASARRSSMVCARACRASATYSAASVSARSSISRSYSHTDSNTSSALAKSSPLKFTCIEC